VTVLENRHRGLTVKEDPSVRDNVVPRLILVEHELLLLYMEERELAFLRLVVFDRFCGFGLEQLYPFLGLACFGANVRVMTASLTTETLDA